MKIVSDVGFVSAAEKYPKNSVKNISPPFLFRLLFRDVIFKRHVMSKILYLTFDDGPSPEVTPQVLDILNEHKAKATFFVCGRQAENNPELLQRIRDEGHTVGNHTYSHPNGWKTATRHYIADIKRANVIAPSRLFRPPYGKLRFRQYFWLRKHYRIVIWDVMCMDFDRNTSRETCFDIIRKNASSGSIIVMHDTEKASDNMLYALRKTLTVFGNEGYRFESLS